MTSTAKSLSPGTVLDGRYTLLERVGVGGMGDVWVAKNQRTGADLAIKTLLASMSNPVRTERLRQEAKLASTLSHRNIVKVFDLVEEPDGTLGLVMELLRGQALSAVMRTQGTLSSLQAAAVVVPVLLALQHAHDVGIVHRDVKPGNVFLIAEPDGAVVPKLLDFGIAKVPALGSSLTLDSEVLGTPRYMSPEQIRSKGEIDGRSDQFGIAVLLYELLTASTPFLASTPSATLAAVLEQEVDPDPRIDPRVWLVIQRALAKRPYERFGSAKEMAKALCEAVSASEETLQTSLRDLKPALRTVPPPVLPDLEVSSRVPTRRAAPPVALAVAAVAFAVFGVGVFGYALAVRTLGSPAREVVAVEPAPRPADPPSLASATIPPIPPPEPLPPAAEPPTDVELPADPAPTKAASRPPSRPPPARAGAGSSGSGAGTRPASSASVRPVATRPDF